jgi:hypothetical protein
MRWLLGFLFIEVGVVLAIVPWSAYWDRNYFAEAIPLLETLVTNNFVRGAVSGLGLVNLAIGISEILSLLSARRSHEPVVSIRQVQSSNFEVESK